MRYNHRDNLGRYARRFQVVPGRLYGYRGTIVRAGRRCSNGKIHVSFHKQLHGFVDETELTLIDTTKVRDYLAKA